MRSQEELSSRLEQECTESEFQWLNKILSMGYRGKTMGFVMAHRFISRLPLAPGKIQPPGTNYEVDLSQWTRDQLARTIILLSLDNGDQAEFHKSIDLLLSTADNRESQAVYASIPFFNYAPSWKLRASEAIRSNVDLIFDAMAFNNPYPADYFEDSAWNQLVLKTIFKDNSIWKILGLSDRRNEVLAETISDFAHERWSAGRSLPPEVWYLILPYPNERYWQDAYRLLTSEVQGNREAGYLLWKEHNSQAPENFTESFRDMFNPFAQKEIDWGNLGQNSSS